MELLGGHTLPMCSNSNGVQSPLPDQAQLLHKRIEYDFGASSFLLDWAQEKPPTNQANGLQTCPYFELLKHIFT